MERPGETGRKEENMRTGKTRVRGERGGREKDKEGRRGGGMKIEKRECA